MKRLCILLCLALIGCASTNVSVDPTATPRLTAGLAASSTAEQRLTPTLPQTRTPEQRLTPTPLPTPAAEQRLTPSPTFMPTPTLLSPTPDPRPLTPAWSYPIGLPGRSPGDGLFVRHGFQVENTWFNPGYWHTGEDWYAIEGDTAGAEVYAVADGEVVYVGSNYPGRVVIVRHADDLFSMYGHLAFEPPVAAGQRVSRGELLGAVLRRSDNVPNHLHYEIRTFLTRPEVNGESPRYGFRCGRNCPPGPGYWPIVAPELPSALGWLNPTHAIATRSTPGDVIVVTQPAVESLRVYADMDATGMPQGDRGELRLTPGDRYRVLDQRVGPDAPGDTGADHYALWYRIALPDGRDGWVQAAMATDFESSSDGSPATVRFTFVPAVDADEE